ncbi:hypothetical protein JA9_002681 [Meyerozyma sp. JA9]|nr:hypothetical protein JA9_002681 [Meyerozyma sp. JA9]
MVSESQFGFHAFANSDTRKHFPTTNEIEAHLKLLKSLQLLQRSMASSNDPVCAAKTWQVFVTNSVRRFIIYVSALKKYMFQNAGHEYYPLDESSMYVKEATRNKRLIEIMASHLPPLDILMVWHAFSLNPKSFYDAFLRNNFLTFVFIPFPLHLVNDAIDNNSLLYKPKETYVEQFNRILSFYGVKMDYTFDGPFRSNVHVVPVMCPVCKKILSQSVALSNNSDSGFADPYFKIDDVKPCCGFQGVINHEQLRRRQFYADLSDKRTLPYIYRFFSLVLNYGNQNPLELDACIKRENLPARSQLKTEPVETFINRNEKFAFRRRVQIIGRNYPQFNLVYLTIPRQDTIQIHEDLVGCVVRQGRFVEAINRQDWYGSPTKKEAISEAILRYSRFLSLLVRFGTTSTLVPTLDIDLVWHTHQLSSYFYFSWCLDNSKDNMVIDHDDKVEESNLNQWFEKTAKLYRSEFKYDYCVCFCWYCVCIRNHANSKLQGIFSSKHKDDKEIGPNLRHISTHNAIALPFSSAEQRRRQVQQKFKDRFLPWTLDNHQKFFYESNLYVVPPLSPIALTTKYTCTFYGTALCQADAQGFAGCRGANCISGNYDGAPVSATTAQNL